MLDITNSSSPATLDNVKGAGVKPDAANVTPPVKPADAVTATADEATGVAPAQDETSDDFSVPATPAASAAPADATPDAGADDSSKPIAAADEQPNVQSEAPTAESPKGVVTEECDGKAKGAEAKGENVTSEAVGDAATAATVPAAPEVDKTAAPAAVAGDAAADASAIADAAAAAPAAPEAEKTAAATADAAGDVAADASVVADAAGTHNTAATAEKAASSADGGGDAAPGGSPTTCGGKRKLQDADDVPAEDTTPEKRTDDTADTAASATAAM